MTDKAKLEKKLGVFQLQYEKAVSDYLRSNRRVDRDRCLTLKARIELLREVLEIG